jgi:hypothetical protein
MLGPATARPPPEHAGDDHSGDDQHGADGVTFEQQDDASDAES